MVEREISRPWELIGDFCSRNHGHRQLVRRSVLPQRVWIALWWTIEIMCLPFPGRSFPAENLGDAGESRQCPRFPVMTLLPANRRIPSVQDLVSFMWAESAPNGTGGLPPKPPSASKQRQAPLNGLPLNGLPDGRGDGRLCRVPSWSGMRHRHLSNQQPKAANPKPGLRKVTLPAQLSSVLETTGNTHPVSFRSCRSPWDHGPWPEALE